jgi:acetyltransferase-like isoleucine patch superfamily enzyme
MTKLEKLVEFWAECRAVRAGLLPVLIRHAIFRLRGKNLLTCGKVSIYGLENMTTEGLLKIGFMNVGFVDRHDRTLLRLNGKIRFKGDFSIGKGCRFDIGRNATVEFETGFINPRTTLIIMHGLTVGAGCSIAWGCQFLDEDFHALSYEGRPAGGDNRIVIGSHVWIGSNVSILKGSVIPEGCVVASCSVVKSRFTEKKALIAGNPAKIVRQNVSWS